MHITFPPHQGQRVFHSYRQLARSLLASLQPAYFSRLISTVPSVSMEVFLMTLTPSYTWFVFLPVPIWRSPPSSALQMFVRLAISP